MPLFKKHCVECHNGTRPAASLAFSLGSLNDPSKLSFQCTVVLIQGFKDPAKPKLEADLFTQSDPARKDVEHEFKFEKDPGAYGPYRDGVLMWLAAE